MGNPTRQDPTSHDDNAFHQLVDHIVSDLAYEVAAALATIPGVSDPELVCRGDLAAFFRPSYHGADISLSFNITE